MESSNVWPWPWPCSQPDSALCERHQQTLPKRSTLCDKRGFENMAPSREPDGSTHHSLLHLQSLLCFSLLHISNSMHLPIMTHFYLYSYSLKHCSDIALENMHHKVLYNTYPQLVSSRLSPTWREAMPKSAILMLFFSSSNRFSGFRSLWLKDSEMKKINQLMKHERPLLKSYKLVQLMWNEKALLKAYQTPVDQAWIHIQECNWEQLSILTGYRATSSSLQQPLSLISPCWN